MNHNKPIYRILLCTFFVAILAAILLYCSRLVERKESAEKNASFFTEAAAGHIDALLIGSSHVVNGINPAQIYEQTGYTVYNLAGHGSTIPVSYWTLVNALDYCTPQFVLIDTYMIEKNYQYLDINVEGDDHGTSTAVDQLHEVFDCFPETANKRAAIADLISDPDTRKEFSFDFIKYHSRWNDLDQDDYKSVSQVTEDSLMGAQLRYEVTPNAEHYNLLGQEDADETETIGKQYLRRIIELCISKGITPVIIQVPFEESEEYQRAANSAAGIASAYGIPFVNMRYVENIINSYSDLQSQTHLSAYGAYKVTNYLAQNTLTQLGMTDHRGDADYESWDTAVSTWHQEILDASTEPADLYAALMMLRFDDVSGVVFINNPDALMTDEVLVRELGDLAGDMTAEERSESYTGTETLQAAAESGRAYLLIQNTDNHTALEVTGESSLQNYETGYGTFNYVSPSIQYNLLTTSDNPDENLLNYDEDRDVDVQILVYNSESGEHLARLRYTNAGFAAE